ncbi:D-tyrosyl-tRNA(Tyr) deacylase [bacterium BMS3Abin07]|nr:D-tyrosyl-tRNA(Tyr) deacylase [bacterium BMS3Abin07]GBE31524.1 D-tyrosyl-tRNA(Tyr) deacylase [bacterium BMS3Bbin05]
MKALIQRVSGAEVSVGGEIVGKTGKGLLVFFCVVKGDTGRDLDYLVRRD